MNESLGIIKIMDGKIITKKDGITKIWSQDGNDPLCYIVYNGLTYKLINDKIKEIDDNCDDELDSQIT